MCECSIPKCGGVLGGNDQNRAEKQNVVLTSFRPVTWSSGHLGRRNTCFWQRQLMAKQLPHGEESKLQKLNLSPLLDGS